MFRTNFDHFSWPRYHRSRQSWKSGPDDSVLEPKHTHTFYDTILIVSRQYIWKMFRSKFDYFSGNDKNWTPKSVGMFRAQNRVIYASFSTFPPSMVPGPEKVINIWSRHFLAIRIGNDKKCVPSNVGIFQVENRVIRARFSTFPALVVPRPVKVIKIWQKHFSKMTRNNKNCTPNCAGMFRVQNRVKILLKHFSVVLTKTIRFAPQTVWVSLRCQTESSEPGFPLCMLLAYSSGTQA